MILHIPSFLLLMLLGINGIAEPPPQVVDRTTMRGKVMCGYQGWFNCDGDGAGLGWMHWSKNPRQQFGPGNVSVDLWPDMSEAGLDERYRTGFQHSDGSDAEVFSSHNEKTVLRHFRWMRDYGIDGVFVQRFANGLGDGVNLRHKNVVLSHCRRGAEEFGRTIAVMYDLSGLRAGEVDRVRRDWIELQQFEKLGDSSRYLQHRGKTLVAIWGIGFSDRHGPEDYSLAECRQLISDLKSLGCSVMLGVPTGWRPQNRDSVMDRELHEILELADVISPWTPGRYRNPEEAVRHANECWQPDVRWCKSRELDYMPVVFPGFSWHNLKHQSPLNEIDRLGGQFLWTQIVAAKRAGAEMIYVAMFDEVDEGTAIFKCTNHPPVANGGEFLTYENFPSDHYLKITGLAGEMLRGEIAADFVMPDLN